MVFESKSMVRIFYYNKEKEIKLKGDIDLKSNGKTTNENQSVIILAWISTYEINTNGRYITLRERIIRKSQEKTRLSHSRISNEKKLE